MAARVGLTLPGLTGTAADLADQAGLDAVTVSELARRVGVRPASLYSHLAGTDELRSRVAALALDELADRLSVALAGRSGRDALAALVDVHRDYARAHPGRWAATQVRVDVAVAGAAGRRVAALMVGVLHGYGLDPAERTHAVRFVGSTVNGFLHLQAVGGFDHSAPDVELSWQRMTDALDTALRRWPTDHLPHPRPEDPA